MDKVLVQAAFNSIRLDIEEFIATQKDRVALCFTVLEPCATLVRLSGIGEPIVLWTGTAGVQDPAKWQGKTYAENAKKKARIVWRTGMSIHSMKVDYPHLFEKGDFKYNGGIIYKGIIVGASGLKEDQDAEWALKLAMKIHELVLEAFTVEFKKSGLHMLDEATP
jgi:hypothetical protein